MRKTRSTRAHWIALLLVAMAATIAWSATALGVHGEWRQTNLFDCGPILRCVVWCTIDDNTNQVLEEFETCCVEPGQVGGNDRGACLTRRPNELF